MQKIKKNLKNMNTQNKANYHHFSKIGLNGVS